MAVVGIGTRETLIQDIVEIYIILDNIFIIFIIMKNNYKRIYYNDLVFVMRAVMIG